MKRFILVAFIIIGLVGCTHWPSACAIKDVGGERKQACACKTATVAHKGGKVEIYCNGKPLPITIKSGKIGKLCH